MLHKYAKTSHCTIETNIITICQSKAMMAQIFKSLCFLLGPEVFVHHCLDHWHVGNITWMPRPGSQGPCLVLLVHHSVFKVFIAHVAFQLYKKTKQTESTPCWILRSRHLTQDSSVLHMLFALPRSATQGPTRWGFTMYRSRWLLPSYTVTKTEL